MIVSNIKIENFRNIKNIEINPCENVNIIYGENAQGKTNIIESIWLFSGQRSFRSVKDSELVKFGEKYFKNEISVFSGGREQKLKLQYEDKKESFINDIKQKSVSTFTEIFPSVVFSPSHMSLVKDGPAERRRFLNIALTQIKSGFSNIISKYNKNVSQRNILLKDVKEHPELMPMLYIFEENIAKLGAMIVYQRLKYIELLNEKCKKIYKGISSGKESFSLKYITNYDTDGATQKDIEKSLLVLLTQNRKEDIMNASTSVGPHRDDLSIEVNNLSVRKYGSQGQQRSCVLTLKLGETLVLEEKTEEKPIILLDDVMSELDSGRQDYILHHLNEYQVFITCCDPSTVLKMKKGKTFHISGGKSEEK